MAPGILASSQPGVDARFKIAQQQLAQPTIFSDQELLLALANAVHTFLQPPLSLHAASLDLAKHYLDPLASSVSDAQVARQDGARKKRKRGLVGKPTEENVLKLKQIHVDGFGIDQVWEQAKRVLDASSLELERCLPDIADEKDSHSDHSFKSNKREIKSSKTVRFEDDMLASRTRAGYDGPTNSNLDTLHDENPNEEAEFEEIQDEDQADADTDGSSKGLEDSTNYEEGAEDIFAQSDLDMTEELGDEQPVQLIEDKHGLNDGFFSIDEFNKNTEFLERQDAKGDPYDGALSDEEEVDWEANPMVAKLSTFNKKLRKEDEEEDSSEDEGGQTFGEADLNAPFDSSDENEDNEDSRMEDDNTNDIFYDHFFAPPPRRVAIETHSQRALPKSPLPSSTAPVQQTEDDIQRTISSVRRDIFSDDDASASSRENDDPSGQANLSTHERRQRSLAAQIRSLEAEAVAQRAWTLSGEARAIDRPLNSLLEESLDFETTGKPIPIITADVSNSIEDLVKQRILARNFDEVPKRRAGADGFSAISARRGLADLELSDQKNKQSLAELYETEHLRKTDSNYVDARDAKLEAQHAQIKTLWAAVAGKLDALSNWHYRPRPSGVEVSVVTDAPRVMMEDTRPSNVAGAAEESGLAPQEVYKPGVRGAEGKSESEENIVFTNAGGVIAKSELSREQKLRRRRREKERAKKKVGDIGLTSASAKTFGSQADSEAVKSQNARGKNKAREEKTVLGDLEKAGVKVIGKKGEISNIDGDKITAIGSSAGKKGNGAGAFKL